MTKNNLDELNNNKEEVPLFNTWRRWYLLVATCFLLSVTLFYLFTKYFE